MQPKPGDLMKVECAYCIAVPRVTSTHGSGSSTVDLYPGEILMVISSKLDSNIVVMLHTRTMALVSWHVDTTVIEVA